MCWHLTCLVWVLVIFFPPKGWEVELFLGRGGEPEGAGKVLTLACLERGRFLTGCVTCTLECLVTCM